MESPALEEVGSTLMLVRDNIQQPFQRGSEILVESPWPERIKAMIDNPLPHPRVLETLESES